MKLFALKFTKLKVHYCLLINERHEAIGTDHVWCKLVRNLLQRLRSCWREALVSCLVIGWHNELSQLSGRVSV